MAAPIPVELRTRVVDAFENGEGTYREIAERYNVGVASVSRWLRLFRLSGSVVPRAMGGSRRTPLSDDALTLLKILVKDEPNWTTTGLAHELNDAFAIFVSRKTVGRALNDMGYTFKRGFSDRQLPRHLEFKSSAGSSSSNSPRWMVNG